MQLIKNHFTKDLSTYLKTGNTPKNIDYTHLSNIVKKIILPPPCWFSLNNSETVEAVTLVFCSIEYHFIRDIQAKFGIPNLPHIPDIGQNTAGGISDFQISGQSLLKVKVAITPEPMMTLTWNLDHN